MATVVPGTSEYGKKSVTMRNLYYDTVERLYSVCPSPYVRPRKSCMDLDNVV